MLCSFIDQLQQAKTEKLVNSLILRYFADQGIRAVAFTLYLDHVHTGNPVQYDWVSPALQRWHTYYLEQHYADVDATLQTHFRGGMPLYWDIQQQHSSAKHAREKRMREESQSFGIDKGLSIPVHGLEGDFASITLHQMQGESGLANYREKQYEWLVVAIAWYHALKRVRFTAQACTDARRQLTEREQQCLALTADQHSVSDIAALLNISAATVNFHLQNANKKLGVKNKHQAVLKWRNTKTPTAKMS